ncbi:MAG: hypothetical protein QNK04_07990 [Myxococcota bacterium]|nr:hypothetical protein [Myxococcota bacterium]
MTGVTRALLESACADAMVVRITRGEFEDEGDLAYIGGLGNELMLLLCISKEIHFDGFAVVRIADVTHLDAPHDHADFVAEALRRRGESVATAPAVSLLGMAAAVRTAGRIFPLVTLFREEADSDVCHIGKVVEVGDERVHLVEIDPDARWDEETTAYRVSEVTRVDFGGRYEEALVLVGGEPPRPRHLRPVG